MKTWDDVGRTHCFSPRHLKEGGDAPIFADLPDVTSMWEIHPIISFYMERNDKIQKILCIDHTSKKDIITDNSTFARYLKKCDNRVIFITHGFLSGDDEEWLIEMRDALLYVEDQIVAIVGWKGGADFTSNFFQEPNVYKQAAVNCLAVGKWVGQVATWLHTAMKRQGGGYLWGIGHSLGAHLMGMAGHVAVDKKDNPLFDRITGLDPAGPGFQTGLTGYLRLCKDDAAMVDVIHTDSRHRKGDERIPYFGTIIPLGTIDFYPNYGFGTKSGVFENHALAHELFTWSMKHRGELKTKEKLRKAGTITKLVPAGIRVNACKEVDIEKNGEAEMGYFANSAGNKRHGNWLVRINPDEPYAPALSEERSCFNPSRSTSLLEPGIFGGLERHLGTITTFPTVPEVRDRARAGRTQSTVPGLLTTEQDSCKIA